MGFLLKTGAGRRLKHHEIDIGEHKLIIGLPANLSRDWGVRTVQNFIDLDDKTLFSSADYAEITELRWDYKAPLWRHFCEKAGSLTLDMIIGKMPNNKTCKNLFELENHIKDECVEFNRENDIKIVQQDYQTVTINGTDWLSYKRLPVKTHLDSTAYYYLTPVDAQHYILSQFQIGFTGNLPKRFPKEYQQAMNDMNRIVNSFYIEKAGALSDQAALTA